MPVTLLSWVLVAQWIEHSPGVWEIMGSSSVLSGTQIFSLSHAFNLQCLMIFLNRWLCSNRWNSDDTRQWQRLGMVACSPRWVLILLTSQETNAHLWSPLSSPNISLQKFVCISWQQCCCHIHDQSCVHCTFYWTCADHARKWGRDRINFDERHVVETATSGKWNGDKRLDYCCNLRKRRQNIRKGQWILSV